MTCFPARLSRYWIIPRWKPRRSPPGSRDASRLEFFSCDRILDGASLRVKPV